MGSHCHAKILSPTLPNECSREPSKPIRVVARNHITEYVTRNAKVLSISLVRWSSDLMGSVTLEPALVLELASDFVSSL